MAIVSSSTDAFQYTPTQLVFANERLLTNILSNLPSKDMLHVTLVNKKFNRLGLSIVNSRNETIRFMKNSVKKISLENVQKNLDTLLLTLWNYIPYRNSLNVGEDLLLEDSKEDVEKEETLDKRINLDLVIIKTLEEIKNTYINPETGMNRYPFLHVCNLIAYLKRNDRFNSNKSILESASKTLEVVLNN